MLGQIGILALQGNILQHNSVFECLGIKTKLIRYSSDLEKCDALILPGVGSFDPAMRNLEQTKLIPYLKNWANKDLPLLGICLGLQLLF